MKLLSVLIFLSLSLSSQAEFNLADLERAGSCEYKGDNRQYITHPCLLKNSDSEKEICFKNEEQEEQKIKDKCLAITDPKICSGNNSFIASSCKWVGKVPKPISQKEFEEAVCVQDHKIEEKNQSCGSLKEGQCLDNKACVLVVEKCTVKWHESGVENCSQRKDESSCKANTRVKGSSFACRWGVEVTTANAPKKKSFIPQIEQPTKSDNQCAPSGDLICNITSSGVIECDNGVSYRENNNIFKNSRNLYPEKKAKTLSEIFSNNRENSFAK